MPDSYREAAIALGVTRWQLVWRVLLPAGRQGLLAAGLLSPLHAQGVNPSMLLLDGALAGSSVVAVGERGTALVSLDRGTSWRRATTPTRATLTGVSFPPVPLPRRGWAVGHEAEILVSVDRGLTGSRQFQGKNRTDSFLDVLALDEQRAIAIGERLGVYRDYPVSKGCTSPFAPIWIDYFVSRQG